ncbi:hypothetical protein EFK50_17795 [Nocardioides marmoriginsengisoli]|uniref:WD40 repeat domain-containing protein n=1 Tax=Nocardioides marmoriginsengisoli TaxID=661483 RepID=A0A3N0CCP9_9ACTN|nr:hypothetical protein [Nocardioides marmoriginsengisoli]RNL61222.1 hypothetical protein EFK50_17795 [Nocardioides marmoriginsengisoli]
MNPAAKNTPENELTKTLRRQADHFSASGGGNLDYAQVVSRAGEIRRGRRMRASMVMAAVVVAVAVPIGITTLASDPVKKTPSVATEPDGSKIGLTAMPTGKAPTNGYLLDGTLYVGKKRLPLGSGGDPMELVRIDGGYLVARSTEQSMAVSFISDNGKSTGEAWPYEGGGIAVSPEGNVGAFVEPDGTVMAVEGGGSRYFEIGSVPAAGHYSARAVVGENCSGRSEETGCTVYVQSNDEKPKVYTISPHQEAAEVDTPIIGLADVRTDGSRTLLAGMISVNDTEPGSCSEVSENGKQLWKTCDYSLDEFSPDGRYVLAGPAYRDGPGDGKFAVLDAATGDLVLDLGTTREAIVVATRWDDDNHVVATVIEGNQSAIVRFETNGSREYASKKVTEPEPYLTSFLLG